MKPADSPEVLARFQSELDLASVIARQVSRSIGTMVQYDDLLSAAREGLLDAARRYDPSRNVPFRAFANWRVRGAIMDCVRKMAALPRRAYERLSAIEAANTVSEGQAEEVFSPATMDAGEAEEALAEHLAATATAVAVGILAEAERSEPESIEAESDPERAYSQAEVSHLVREAVAELPPRDAQIVRLYHFEGKSMEAIARELNIDKSWVSRVHSRAMARLTERLAGLE